MNIWRPWNLFSTLETGNPFLLNFNSGGYQQSSQFRYWHILWASATHCFEPISSQHHTSAPDPCEDCILDVEHCDPKQYDNWHKHILTSGSQRVRSLSSSQKIGFHGFFLFDFLAILWVFDLRSKVSSIFKILFILCVTLLLSNSQFRRQNFSAVRVSQFKFFGCSDFPNHSNSRLLVLCRPVAWHYFAEIVFFE